MKITGIETLCLSRPHEPEHEWITGTMRTIKADAVIVVIHTDEGVDGIGEACPYGVPPLIREWVEWLSPELIGREVGEAATHLHPNGRTADYMQPPYIPPYDAAVAGIDIALWDLRAKREGKSICDLITPHAQHAIPLYASSGCRYDWRRPEQLIEETLGYRNAGFTACKVRIGTEWSWDNVTVDRFLGLMGELRAAVGNHMRLMVDGNKRLTVEQSFAIAKGLDQLGFTWFEEPFPYEHIDAYARLNASVNMPITGGEQFTTLEQFRPYFEQHCFDIVQPDVACSGITEALRVAEVAERYGVQVIPHNWHHGLMTMANAHYVATLPHPHSLELCMIQGPLQWEILHSTPSITDGVLTIPDSSGIGVDLASNLALRFPYIEGHYAIVNLR